MATDGLNRLWVVAAGLIVMGGYFIWSFLQHRAAYRNLPGPPHSMFWGHLKLMGEYSKRLPPGAYAQTFITQMKIDHNLPDMFYLDLWPAGPCMIVCAGPDACSISTTKAAFDMPPLVTKYFEGNAGTNFIEVTNGPLWKRLHHMLAPGLTPNATRGYTGSIIDEALNLYIRLGEIAKSNEMVDLHYEIGKYPFQVIGHVLLGETLSSGAYEVVRKAIETQCAINATLSPLSKRRLRKELNQCFRTIEAEIEPMVRIRFATLQRQKVPLTKKTAVTLLDRMLLSQIDSGQQLDESVMRLVLDNVNGTFVAGYGTTTDTSSYIIMLLTSFPLAMEKLREEHDRVFGKDIAKTINMLRDNPSLINELKYTTAVINETLRMFPIGFGVRSPPSDMTAVEFNGQIYPTKGRVFALLSHSIHYCPKYFEEPKAFKPERFLDEEPTFPRNAYRPFERGLRSCLGQPLAMDEMKIMLLLVARSYDFELKDHGPVAKPKFSFTDMDTKIGRHAFQVFGYTATPPSPVSMKVSLAK